MKNLKKLSREELKKVSGGTNQLDVGYYEPDNGGSGGCYQCCISLYNCGGCSDIVSCPSGQFLRSC